jgi:hypothetical protein
VVRAGCRIEPNLTSMGKLILAKMREGVERMDAPQAMDEVESLAIPSSGVLARQSQPCHFQPLPSSSSPPAHFGFHTTLAHCEQSGQWHILVYCMLSWRVSILVTAGSEHRTPIFATCSRFHRGQISHVSTCHLITMTPYHIMSQIYGNDGIPSSQPLGCCRRCSGFIIL